MESDLFVIAASIRLLADVGICKLIIGYLDDKDVKEACDMVYAKLVVFRAKVPCQLVVLVICVCNPDEIAATVVELA